MDTTRLCQGLSDISDSYQGYIIDQWGVLHNGEKIYTGVMDTLAELKNRNKQLIILSNSGKRAEDNVKRLEKMGFDTGLFDHIVTSGELTWEGLRTRNSGIFQGLGENCLLFSRGGDTSIVDGLDLKLVERAEDADFILVSGSDAPNRTLPEYEAFLRIGVQKGIKLLCANPDIDAIMGDNIHFGAGVIAQRYKEFGGVVDYIGKPFPPVIRHAQGLFKNVLPSSTVVVGDSLAHDIMGGANCGLDTCLVAGGVHMAAFRNVRTAADAQKVIRTLSVNFGVRPTYWVPRFAWGKALPDRKNKRRKPKS